MKLTDADYDALARCFITPEIADAAGLYRVTSIEGRDLVGRRGSGDYSGIVFPYRPPNGNGSVLDRLRLDQPPIEAGTGKELHKYLMPPTARNRVYFPPCDATLLTDIAVSIVLTEGEKKALALWRAASQAANGRGRPAFLPISIPGVWSFKGIIGACTIANGQRVPEHGVLPDFGLITWKDRDVTIAFDANAATNPGVAAARRELAAELTRRGALVRIADMPSLPDVNGVDDLLAHYGLPVLNRMLDAATPYEWRKELQTGSTGKILANLTNATIALGAAPEWSGVLAFDEFAHRIHAARATPWGRAPERWTDHDDRSATMWLQRHGIQVGVEIAAQAVEAVAQERRHHPVREFLESLKWDGISRINDWPVLYLNADSSPLTRAIGAKWMISAVARIFEPGAKADCCLILEGPQGSGKSSALGTLGEPWFTDDISGLGSKDAALSTIGVWIIELAELDAMTRAEVSSVKAFLSRDTDRFRPPYARRVIEARRQCVFAGTVNHNEYLRDETGGRRFWPVTCGRVNLEALRRDRDQLWAEAVARYRAGEHWWIEGDELLESAIQEQEARLSRDPWETLIEKWLNDRDDMAMGVTTADVLDGALSKPRNTWTRADEMRVGAILRRLGWEPRRAARGNRTRAYYPNRQPTT